MTNDKELTTALEKPGDVQIEFETSIQVAGKDESFPANRDAHHDKVLTRKLLFKLDTRCVLLKSCISSELTTFFAESSSCSYAPFSTEPTSATPKSWASRKIWGCPTVNMPTDSPSSLLFTSRPSCPATWCSRRPVRESGWPFSPPPGVSAPCVWALFETTPISSSSGRFWASPKEVLCQVCSPLVFFLPGGEGRYWCLN